MSASSTRSSSATPSLSSRLASIDAFRGLTILGMILAIALSAGGYQHESPSLPWVRSWLGSLPISAFFHAEFGAELWKERKIEELKQQGVSEKEAERAFRALDLESADTAATHHEVASAENDGVSAWSHEILTNEQDTYQRAKHGIGVTFIDLVAPWFMLIMGVCVPLSLKKHIGKPEFWQRVLKRTFLLIAVGMLYISLIFKQVSIWWGILQTIGVAYFCAALFYRAPRKFWWPILLGIALLNLGMTSSFAWWTNAWEDIERPFGSLNVPGGDWLKIWKLHCQPWLSISYGVIAMIGVIVGEKLIRSSPAQLLRTGLAIGLFFAGSGYAIHAWGLHTGHYELGMSKADVTTSYAFFTAGLGVLVYLLFYLIIDVWKISSWAAPLAVFGVNPLLAYFMQVIVRRALESLGLYNFFERVSPENITIQNWALFLSQERGKPSACVLEFFSKAGWMGVFWGLIATALVWLVVLYCNRRKIYWKL